MRIRPLLFVLTLAGCASATSIPDTDRETLTHSLEGQPRFLKLSCYKGPFWSDDGKQLLTDVPPDELEFIDDTNGQAILAGPATGIVEAGRRVRIIKVEFPTALVVAGRLVYTPRYNPWVYLQVEGETDTRPLVLVLRAGMTTSEQFRGSLGQFVTDQDPAAVMTTWSDEIKKAVAAKKILPGMDAVAAEMAWGIPQKKHIEDTGGNRLEKWTWGKGKRALELSDGKVIAWPPTR